MESHLAIEVSAGFILSTYHRLRHVLDVSADSPFVGIHGAFRPSIEMITFRPKSVKVGGP